MKSRRRLSLVALILIGFSIVIYAQDFSLKGRSEIEFNLGLWGGAKVANTITTTSIRSEAKTSGLAGNLLAVDRDRDVHVRPPVAGRGLQRG